jgi:hypothetical protein
MPGSVRERLGDLSGLAGLLDQPEVRKRLDHSLQVLRDVVGSDREPVRLRAGELPVLRREGDVLLATLLPALAPKVGRRLAAKFPLRRPLVDRPRPGLVVCDALFARGKRRLQ